jgi:hypothetical protein
LRKILAITSLTLSLVFLPISIHAVEPHIDVKQGLSYKHTPSEGSIEELFKDVIVTLIEPYITKEVEKYYAQPLQYDLSTVEFLKIHRPEYRSFSFVIKLQICPFVGAYNTIGIDNITLKVSPVKTEVYKFEHIKSFTVQ